MKRSNCLFQAIYHRVKYGYTMYYVKPHQKDGLPHFVWWNHDIRSYQHYTLNRRKRKVIDDIFFDGYIDNFPYERIKVRLVKII